MFPNPRPRFPLYNFLKTGQTVSYVTGDDGDLELGGDHVYEILTTGQYSGTTAIVLNGKTDTHSNECVKDLSTGLMWSRVSSQSVGASSNGALPFNTNANGEGYFTYAAAANAANLGSHNDWIIPNRNMVLGMLILAAPLSKVDLTAFPAVIGTIATSTVSPNLITSNEGIFTTTSGLVSVISRTTAGARVWLVRRF